jgi:hypothetical protein
VNEKTLRRLLSDVADLKRTSVRYRVGVVSDTAPLDVKLGGSDTAYENVKGLAAGGGSADDTVAVLVVGRNDLIVLGAITGTPLRTVRGIVTSAGAVLEGDGYTPSRTGTGLFTITFDTAFSGIPSLNPTPFGSSGLGATITAHTASAISIRISNASNTATDAAFHFIAVGPA